MKPEIILVKKTDTTKTHLVLKNNDVDIRSFNNDVSTYVFEARGIPSILNQTVTAKLLPPTQHNDLTAAPKLDCPSTESCSVFEVNIDELNKDNKTAIETIKINFNKYKWYLKIEPVSSKPVSSKPCVAQINKDNILQTNIKNVNNRLQIVETYLKINKQRKKIQIIGFSVIGGVLLIGIILILVLCKKK